jgi:hypothetical protein
MRIFKDNAGREWTIALSIGDIKRVKDLLGVNLFEPESGEPPLLTRIGTDIILLCDIVYCLIKVQADKLGITDEEFGRALGGEAILAAQKAFYEELIDFFRQSGRTDRSKITQIQQKLIEQVMTRINLELDKFDLEKQTDQMFGNLSINSPVV